jgi:hypothetical protein
MDGAIAEGVKTRPSFHDMILPEDLPGNDFDYMDGATIKGVKTRPSYHDILPEVLPGNDCLTTWMVR